MLPLSHRSHSVFESFAMTGVLIIVENLTVPLDRRVWQEAKALTRAGYTVSVACPKGGVYQESYELREGVHIFRHPLPIEAEGIMGYLIEYIWSWCAELYLAIKAYRKVGFSVIQACNPPDTIFLIGLLFRFFCKTKFVFDHHDPFSALFEVKFPGKKMLNWLPKMAERYSLHSADQIISTSEELRKLAIHEHGVSADKIQIVRSGLDLKRMPQVEARPELKRGRKYLALYVGVMGVQDGLDLLLYAAAHMVHTLGRTDVSFALAGGGTEMPALQKLCTELKLDDHVTFTGYLEGATFLEYFATADVGLCPDPKNVFNDKLSMNKVLEYMAFGVPVVQFDLNEGRFIAQEASVYAAENDPKKFAEETLRLLDNPELRSEMGRIGRARIAASFAWDQQEKLYVETYNRLMNKPVQDQIETQRAA